MAVAQEINGSRDSSGQCVSASVLKYTNWELVVTNKQKVVKYGCDAWEVRMFSWWWLFDMTWRMAHSCLEDNADVSCHHLELGGYFSQIDWGS